MKVVITGGAGQIAYSLVSHLLDGSIFKEPIDLYLLEIEPAMTALQGVIMELYDANLSFKSIVGTSNAVEAFKDADYAILVGAFPRKQGMDRKDLLKANVNIFKQQGEALNHANPSCKVIVVGNPANTNAYIASHYCSKLPKSAFTALTKLDENRLKIQLALHLKCPVNEIENCFIYGNHSNTQVPDLFNATVNGTSISKMNKSLNTEDVDRILDIVVNRGAAIIKARQLSSALSAARAIADHLKSLHCGTNGKLISMGIYTENVKGVPDGLVFSVPCRVEQGKIIANEIQLHDSLKERFQKTIAELSEEKEEALKHVQ
eukprot:NODE_540_length_6251_cov_1.082250.p2 type:complete len:319 gc:universal NODE_540_length_6251_cov_1.082250:2809-3765(+)